MLLATGLAAGPLAQASTYLQQFSYFKKLKEAEAAVDAPAVFARLEAMDPQQRAAFVADKYGRFDTLRTMRSLSGDASGAAQASVWFDVASGSPARYAAQDGKALESAAAEDAIAAIVLKGATGGYAVLAGRPGGYDMQVFHPDETMHGPHGRPLWMERQAGLRAHPVPTNLLPASGRRLIQAFHAGDGAGAIPADQVMVEAGKPAPALMLPEGQFRYGVEE
jgi:hypothetical protein